MNPLPYKFDDGGKPEILEFIRVNRDCACRALAIAAQFDYMHAYKLILHYAGNERLGKRKRGISHPERGVYPPLMRRLLADLGWKWVPTMMVGSGCRIHLRQGELPNGRLIVNLSKHYVAVIHGVVHDISNPTRGGTRCVYGYWIKEP